MLFNSLIYLFAFLPIVAFGFYTLGCTQRKWLVNIWLIGASLVFYSYWVPEYLPLILASIGINFSLYRLMGWKYAPSIRKLFFVIGCLFNLGLLGYYKYYDFFIENVAYAFSIKDPVFLKLALPLGISFFTFQQIAFLADSYKSPPKGYSFIDYSLFVSFFPQLIAGPIVHHMEMMPQFAKKDNTKVNWNNIYVGLFLISLGLFKKVVVADTFAVWVNEGFSNPDQLTFLTGWKTSLSYTIQLYFDFSGYTDMALGSARLFNIKLPLNFNSPYISLDIQDFWRRWHITLSRFLRDYLYIPLGGNRNGEFNTYRNLFITFLLGGIWHGAGWTFIAWGALHGLAIVIHRAWKKLGGNLPSSIAWLVTFMFINMAWVYFRAPDISSAHHVLLSMAAMDMRTLKTIVIFLQSGKLLDISFVLPALLAFILQDLLLHNSQQWAHKCFPSRRYTFSASAMFWIGTILLMNQNRFSEFIYFQF